MSHVIGIDIGGTFTDCAIVTSDGRVHIGKAPTTTGNFGEGFIAAIAAAAERIGASVESLVADAEGIYHGCTVGTNALVEGKTAKVGLVTTRGHADTIFAMQAGRRLINHSADAIAHVAAHTKPAPLVPKNLVVEIDERLAFDGGVLLHLNVKSTQEGIQTLVENGAEAFAVSLLWSVVSDVHERQVEELIREVVPNAFVSISSAVVPRIGEYERTVAAVINSAVGPVMKGYLEALTSRLAVMGYERPLHVMTCTGGLIDTVQAVRRPVLTIGSGPVAGLIGAGLLARADETSAGMVISADMGGTTFDVGMIDRGSPLHRATSWHGQYEYFVPTLDVRSIGSGGGSIVRHDVATGTLRVGPESAGSTPGPVCYGHGGTQPTVSDADVVLGVLNPDYFLGGEMKLDAEKARAALAEVGATLGMDAIATAAAASRIVDNAMADAIRLVSVQQGQDPRNFEMYAFGGAGPVHGAAVAEELGLAKVVVPLADLASCWSAFGVAGSDAMVTEELGRAMVYPFESAEVRMCWKILEERAIEAMLSQGHKRDDITLERAVDMKYQLQVHVLEVPVPMGDVDESTSGELVQRFEKEYERVYGEGTGYPAAGFALTAFRVRARAVISNVELRSLGSNRGSTTAVKARRPVVFAHLGSGQVDTVIIDGPTLQAEELLDGPAVLEYPDTSVVVPPGWQARRDGIGSVVLERTGLTN